MGCRMENSKFTPADINDGFVVAVTIEAMDGQSEAVAAILEELVAPTMAEPGVKLFIPYRSPTNPLLFFVFELYVDEVGRTSPSGPNATVRNRGSRAAQPVSMTRERTAAPMLPPRWCRRSLQSMQVRQRGRL
jgi:hypothetical protein